MAYINFQPSDFFNTVLYTGNASTNNITGVGFQPDWLWIKGRSGATNHRLFDSTRGNTKYLASNNNDAEGTDTTALTSFDSDGFSLVSDGQVNGSGTTYASWNWKANGGTTESNTDGTITSTVQANTTAGFSIVTYSGTGSAGSVGHGLGVTPKFVMPKCRNVAQGWAAWHTGLSGSGYIIELNEVNAEFNNGTGSYTALPSSSVVNLGSDHTISGRDYVMYCFAEVKGYSKFGKYIGNGSSDGPFIYTGFRPGFVMIKRIDSTGGAQWVIQDSKRRTFNPVNVSLYPNLNNAEATGETFRVQDFCSNGFKIRSSTDQFNGNGASYIYLAFAEFPLIGSNGIVGTAR